MTDIYSKIQPSITRHCKCWTQVVHVSLSSLTLSASNVFFLIVFGIFNQKLFHPIFSCGCQLLLCVCKSECQIIYVKFNWFQLNFSFAKQKIEFQHCCLWQWVWCHAIDAIADSFFSQNLIIVINNMMSQGCYCLYLTLTL